MRVARTPSIAPMSRQREPAIRQRCSSRRVMPTFRWLAPAVNTPGASSTVEYHGWARIGPSASGGAGAGPVARAAAGRVGAGAATVDMRRPPRPAGGGLDADIDY